MTANTRSTLHTAHKDVPINGCIPARRATLHTAHKDVPINGCIPARRGSLRRAARLNDEVYDTCICVIQTVGELYVF